MNFSLQKLAQTSLPNDPNIDLVAMEKQLQENVESLYPILTEILTEQVNPDLEILSDENDFKQYAKVNKGTKFLIYIYDE